MKIDAITTRLYRIPPTVSWEDATHRVSALEFVVAQVSTDTGLVGEGFTYTTGVGGSSILALINDYLVRMLLGEDPLRVTLLWRAMYDQLHRCGVGGINTLALATLDIALWDLVGQHHNEPLYRLLGAAREQVPVYASGIDLFMSEEDLLAHVSAFLDSGFDTVKIKIGKDDPHEDASRVAAVRRLIGPQRRLMVDANQKWTLWEAFPRLKLLAPWHVMCVEEPLHAEDIAGHADLRRLTQMPVAIGESLYTRYQFMEYLRAEAVDIIQADICRVGGITEWVAIAQLAAAFHRPIAPHFVPEISVSVLCGIDNGLVAEWVRGGSFSEMNVLRTPLRMDSGMVYPFSDPGHGIRFDYDRLARYEVTSEMLQMLDARSARH